MKVTNHTKLWDADTLHVLLAEYVSVAGSTISDSMVLGLHVLAWSSRSLQPEQNFFNYLVIVWWSIALLPFAQKILQNFWLILVLSISGRLFFIDYNIKPIKRIFPIRWSSRIRRLHLCRGVRPPPKEPSVSRGWRLVILEGRILVAEQSMTQVLSDHMTCNTPLRPLLGQKRPDLINRLVMSSPSTNMFKSRPYSTNYSNSK